MKERKAKGEYVADEVVEEQEYAKLVEQHLGAVRYVLTECRVPQALINSIEESNRRIFQAQILALQKSVKRSDALLYMRTDQARLAANPDLIDFMETDLADHMSPAEAAIVIPYLRKLRAASTPTLRLVK